MPAAEVAIVPGALVQPNGKMSVMLGDRVEQAARLWHAGKVEKILVSGDHHTWAYDEPDTMRKALVARRGAAARHLRGPRRLRHLGDDGPGALDLQRHRRGRRHPGLPHAAGAVPRRRSRDRRHRARRRPAPLGLPGARRARFARSSRGSRRSPTSPSTPRRWPAAEIPIQTADGRESWGPAPPPGTPPAGSPRPPARAARPLSSAPGSWRRSAGMRASGRSQ